MQSRAAWQRQAVNQMNLALAAGSLAAVELGVDPALAMEVALALATEVAPEVDLVLAAEAESLEVDPAPAAPVGNLVLQVREVEQDLVRALEQDRVLDRHHPLARLWRPRNLRVPLHRRRVDPRLRRRRQAAPSQLEHRSLHPREKLTAQGRQTESPQRSSFLKLLLRQLRLQDQQQQHLAINLEQRHQRSSTFPKLLQRMLHFQIRSHSRT